MKLWKASTGLATLCLSLVTSAGPVFAGPLEWRGFLTLGTAVTDSEVPYQTGINRKARVSDETFLGLNLSKELTKEWRIAGQILGRSGQADSAAKVDWAFVTYEPSSDYEISLGKQKIPMWMISEYIDVGRAYPWVVPPEEVYSIFPLKAFTGAAGEYHFNIGDSVLTASAYGGDVVYESQPNAPTANTKFRGNNMFGMALELAFGNSLLRAAYNQAAWDLNLGADRDFGERRLQVYSFGYKGEYDSYLIMAEYAGLIDQDEDHYLDLSRRLAGDVATAPADQQTAIATRSALLSQRIGGNKGWYTTLGKEFLEDFLVHLTYASVKRPYQETLNRDQSSFALGLNYDLNTDSVVKFEGKRVEVPDDSQGLFVRKPDDNVAMVYRLGYSLVF